MLEWFVSKGRIDSVINEGTLLSDGVELNPEKLPCTCVDENVNLFRIRKYFTDASWSRVLKAVELKKKMKYYCQVCEQDLEQEERGLLSICCDGCLQWLHLPCAGLKVAPKQKEWFCQLCKNNVHFTKKQNIDHTSKGSAVNRLRLKQQNRKVKLCKPAQSQQPITISLGEEEIDEQDTYEITPDTKLLQSDLSVSL